jgi:DNA modification methylase
VTAKKGESPILYQSDLVTLYGGRCEDVLPTLGKDAADVVVTDPPYGMNYQSNKGKNFTAIEGDDGKLDLDAIYVAVCRVLRRGRHIYAFGGLGFGDATPICGKTQIVWDKSIVGMGDLTLPWAASHEMIDFGVYELSKVNRDEKGYGKLVARMRQGTVVNVQRRQSGQVNRHPTEKPVELLAQLIESFVGSGSTCVAAIITGRRSIGIELDPQYHQVAIDRVVAAEKACATLWKL